MKKVFLMALVMFVLAGVLVSCNANHKSSNIETGTESYPGEDSVNSGSNLENDPQKDIMLSEKSGNKVYFSVEKKDIYYPEIRNYEQVASCFEIPKDDNGGLMLGAYLKVIGTYEELLTYITPVDFDAKIFNSNYVVCVKQSFFDGRHAKRLIGYYALELNDGEYDISLDYYRSEEKTLYDLPAVMYQYINYIIVPKSTIEYSEQVQQIIVNGRNDIGDEHSIKANEQSHSYITHNVNVALPENPTSWVIESDSKFESSYGLEHGEVKYRVVLYLPDEPSCDFMIKEKKIKNGNLYLTIEAYRQYTNKYLNKNDVKFYDLCIEDSSELTENYDVYILIKEVC
ncbi:MAG: hypothetical protein IJ400_04925 [Clostridia bacterium]|nr:hypothetical protein [Clostridia bacterium]